MEGMEQFAALVAGDMNGLDARIDAADQAANPPDTGWRDITAGVPNHVSGRLLIRRRGNELMVALDQLVLSVSGQVEFGRLPNGLRPLFRIRDAWFPSTGTAAGGHVNISGGGYFNVYDVVADQAMTARMTGDFPDGYAFPSPTPGDPA